jgi:hypothetical protein
MREYIKLAVYALAMFSAPIAFGAIANHTLGQSWNAPVGGSISHYEAR